MARAHWLRVDRRLPVAAGCDGRNGSGEPVRSGRVGGLWRGREDSGEGADQVVFGVGLEDHGAVVVFVGDRRAVVAGREDEGDVAGGQFVGEGEDDVVVEVDV